MFIKKILIDCLEKKNLNYNDVTKLFNKIFKNKLSLVLITAIIIALRSKGESIEEIIAIVKVLRKFLIIIPNNNNKVKDFLDIVGTGGDLYNTFNISTASMFVVAAAGVKIAKHGGRFISSSSGSADVLEELGVNINLKSKYLLKCISKTGIGFMLSSNYYKCIKNISFLRKELKIKTIFNIIAPLVNPLNVQKIFMGVFNKNLIKIQIYALKCLNFKKAIVLCGEDGLDEVTLNGYTYIAELINNKIVKYKIHPQYFGINIVSSNAFKVNNVKDSKQKILDVFYGKKSHYYDIVVLNSAVILYFSKISLSIREGISKACEIINNGLALKKLNQFIYVTNNF
ncbi:anthranilate phosphoribosyltransferase [Candidatus Zinderia endosymbiont of Aphrophora alni]|uniref:anthranilate phosphoribosyltransferase n=1 Tax=Candidatus Zinderia endosymbiont of Aphrophora alni TaxID=3077951 RepID=UPI0030CD6AB3